MKYNLISVVFVISLNSLATLYGQTDKAKDTLRAPLPQQQEMAIDPLDLEIGEMIFDETITKVGRDFYDEFYTNWSNPTSITDFSITIKERPMPGVGTQITVLIDEYEIIKQFIRPNQEMIIMLAEYTVGVAGRYLINYQAIQAELQNEDQTGTGIY